MAGTKNGNKHTLHTSFLTSANTKQTFDALMRGGVATQELAARAKWRYNIQDTSIPALNCHSVNCNALNEQLKKLNLASDVEGNDPSARRETEAREQLVVDLALSNDVYSARQLHSSATDEATRDTMTHPAEISHMEEPPEVKFGYFRPIRKSGVDHYANKDPDGEQDRGVSSPLGVRLLLAEWKLGTDPNDYVYRDPYGLADMDEQPTTQFRKAPGTTPMTQKKQMAPQRPPVVVAAATQPPVVHTFERAPPVTQSQVIQRRHSQQIEPGLDAFSQEPLMSTQVLPGPFGGRPAAGKKPAKKRIGGF